MPIFYPAGIPGPVGPQGPAGAGVQVADSASTVSNNTVVFSNANGVSFGINGSTLTGTVATNYQSQGAYLTTAMQSGSSSVFAKTGFTTTTIANAVVAGTHNTDGLLLAVPAYLTTADLSANSSNYVRNWNLTSNTAGTTSSAQGTDLWLAGGQGITLSGNSNTIAFSVGSYITTAMQSASSSVFAKTGFTTTTVAGAVPTGTHDTAGLLFGAPAWLTTAALSANTSNYAGANFATTTTNGVVIVGTNNTTGLTLAVPPYLTTAQAPGAYLTTAALSGDTSKYAQNWKLTSNTAGTTSSAFGTDLWLAGGQGITLSGNSNSITFSVGSYITTADLSANSSTYFQKWSLLGNTAGTTTTQSLSILQLSGGQGITLSGNSNTVVFSVGSYITTGALSGDTSKYIQNWKLVGNLAGTTSSAQGTDLWLSGGANVTLSGNSNTIVISAPAPSGATYTNYFEPFPMLDASATSTHSLSQLGLQPFRIPANLSFGGINVIGQGTVVPTSASNNWSVRLTNSTQALVYSAGYSVTNQNDVDVFLFKRGTGVFSSELETFASSRNSFQTFYFATQSASATLTNTAGGSLKFSQQFSMSISYPFLTSATSTSVNPASSYTQWGTGYTTWTSTASNSSSDTISTSAAKALAVASTYPATVGWSGTKLIYLNFGTSLSPGEYWLGIVRYSGTSSSSSSGSSITGAAGTGASYSVTYAASNLTQTAMLTWVGKTNTIANSLGSFGFVTTNNMGPMFGLGSHSGTWISSDTYLNNLANPAGAVAFTQLRTDVSFFQTWFQLASNRI